MRGRLPRAMGTAPDDDDIFCLVKATMSSKELCQDPLLVWPASLQSSSRDAFQGVDDPGCPIQRCELDDGRRQELRALKMALQRDFPQLHRVAAWYDSMINGDGFGERPAPLTFLREARAHRVNWSDFQLGQRAPGPRPHELQVVGQKNLGQHLQDVFGGSDRLERFNSHFGEFVAYGYRASIGTVEVRFPKRDGGSRTILQGSAGISDGQTKVLIMAAVIGFLVELEITVDDVAKDAALSAVLESFASVRKSAGKQKEEEGQKHPVKKDEGDSDSDSSAGGKDRDPDDVDVRDVRYKLENLVMKLISG
eukprot:Skav226339  [mRNA]  locus=scaffold3640:62522:68202:- [translate_table: standard]